MSHNHSHNGHSHSHSHNANKKALTVSFILISLYMIVEFVGGYITNSLALLSDAGHMLSDSFALGLSLSALLFGQRAATTNKTFGYKRFEILAALLNGLILVIIAIFICKEAIARFSQPESVVGEGMIIISTIGLIINLIVAWILSRGEAKDNLNVRSAFLHVIGDLLGSVGAIIAALLIIFFGWNIADPIASIIVSVLVLYSGWHIIKESVNILMEGKPANVNSESILLQLRGIGGVVDVHDLHIWMITSDFTSLTVHLVVGKDVDRDNILEKAIFLINKESGIKHITIQTEGRPLDLHDECKL
ncbi:cation transporter [Dysgonomonas sp. 216]|uniref:cation diffusion facilitator family transporter n=1 Tax=Dysgonomonas sp. 216 TaxID=2302934 RepID=UPI0013D1BF1A|nr:cation diffusion facilitator family transporter [Dysgonomonas sp. 216]NDW17600.1 cation transporter [Dysgonomonas sp. 216]